MFAFLNMFEKHVIINYYYISFGYTNILKM